MSGPLRAWAYGNGKRISEGWWPWGWGGGLGTKKKGENPRGHNSNGWLTYTQGRSPGVGVGGVLVAQGVRAMRARKTKAHVRVPHHHPDVAGRRPTSLC